MTAAALVDGTITQVIGPAVDVEFPAGQLPGLLTAGNSTSTTHCYMHNNHMNYTCNAMVCNHVRYYY